MVLRDEFAQPFGRICPGFVDRSGH